MIPNIIHFVFGLAPIDENNPFGLVHYLAVKSAACVNEPKAILFHYKHEPHGEWWELARPLLTLNQVEPPQEIFGNRLLHVAHQADVLRLQALEETGGIYLDMDTISVKPLRDFGSRRFAIGRQLHPPSRRFRTKLRACVESRSIAPLLPQGFQGLCNAVMLSEKGSPFIRLWLDSYRTFRSQGRDDFWDEHSVQVPLQLARSHPQLVDQLSPYFFHYPLWDEEGLSLLFEKSLSFRRAYLHHLWQGLSWDRYLRSLSVADIHRRNTTYNRIARRYLS
jgi:hypothetical protein